MVKKFKPSVHNLVPPHFKLSESEAKKILNNYHITVKELPKLLKTDPALADLNVKSGDVIKIVRKSPTSGESIYYRGVVSN